MFEWSRFDNNNNNKKDCPLNTNKYHFRNLLIDTRKTDRQQRNRYPDYRLKETQRKRQRLRERKRQRDRDREG